LHWEWTERETEVNCPVQKKKRKEKKYQNKGKKLGRKEKEGGISS